MDCNAQIEQILIRDLKKGSRKAFNRIYSIYAKRLYAYCLQYTKNIEDAEDILQDVFVHLWEIRTEIKQEDTLKSLLFIMSKNRLINSYRTRINSPVYEDFVNCRHISSDSNTSSMLEYEEFFHNVRSLIKKLPSTQEKVLELSLICQLKNKEVADKLGLSEQTIKNQLSVGLKSLRESLKKSLFLTILGLIPY